MPWLKIFPEAPDEADLLKARGHVSGGADVVVSLGVGGKLGAALTAPPVLSGRDQGATDALPSSAWINEPTFEVCHTLAATPFRVRSDRELRKAGQVSVLILGNEHGKRLTRVTGEETLDVRTMLVR